MNHTTLSASLCLLGILAAISPNTDCVAVPSSEKVLDHRKYEKYGFTTYRIKYIPATNTDPDFKILFDSFHVGRIFEKPFWYLSVHGHYLQGPRVDIRKGIIKTRPF